MTTKFSNLLEDYLYERDKLNSGYYDDRWFVEKHKALDRLKELGEAMDELINGKEHNND